MKSLSLSRPLVIIMIGVPGSGKSFFARQFAEMFNSPMISNDRIRTELFAESTFSSDEEKIILRISELMSEQLFKTQRSFIIDGGMNSRSARYEVAKQAKKYGFDSLLVWVQTDERTSVSRSQRRSDKKYDEFNQSLSVEQYQKLVKTFAPPSPRDKVLVISGKHTFATQARMMLKRLAPARENQVHPQTNAGQRIQSRPTTTPPQSHTPPQPIQRRVTIQ